jgi:ATP-dependent exoDNAse (exonuclease V) alpha subunit
VLFSMLDTLRQVHKAQGQTLARVKVDLAKTFAKGQGAVLTPNLPVLH